MKPLALLTHILSIHLLLVSMFAYSSEAVPLIDSFKVDGSSMRIEINEEFVDQYLREGYFFATYDDSVNLAKLPYSISIIPFLTNVISIVWISGRTYIVPEMDEDLFYTFYKIREIFKQKLYPNTAWEGTLIAEKLVKNKPMGSPVDPTEEAGLLFSGGIDSTCSAYELQEKNLKLLLIMMRGQGSAILKDDNLWNKQSTLASDFAKRYGHNISFLTSNYHRFLARFELAKLSPEVNDWRVDAIEDIGMFGMTAPLLFTKGLRLLHMASSRDWSYPIISVGNPLVDSFMCFANDIKLQCSQFNFTRADKIEYIINKVKSGLKPPLIHVCYKGKFPNCLSEECRHECRKCLPTALGFLALGADPRDYGFNTTGEELIEYAKEYLTKTHPHITLWQLKRLQEKLREQDNKKFSWFLETDLAAHVAMDYIKGKPSLSWEDLRDLASDIDIPLVEKKVLVMEETH